MSTTTTTTTTAQSATTHTLPAPFSSSPDSLSLITQGAEALLYKTHFLNPTTPAALKVRPAKPWRHPTLDKRLTRQRILAEARVLVKCRREGVPVPAVLELDWEKGWVVLEWVEGGSVKEGIRGWEGKVDRDGGEMEGLLRRIGQAVGRLHGAGVVHGDLTTSNMMLRPSRSDTDDEGGDEGRGSLEGEVVLIDFGLAMQATQEEERAVDLYVLERAFGSTHPRSEGRFGVVLEAYGGSYKGAKATLKRLEDAPMGLIAQIEKQTQRQVTIATDPEKAGARCHPQDQSPLFRLPGEIRNVIFSFATEPELERHPTFHYEPLDWYPKSAAQQKHRTALLPTCRRIWLEANHLPMQQATHTLSFVSGAQKIDTFALTYLRARVKHHTDFLKSLTANNTSNLNHIRIPTYLSPCLHIVGLGWMRLLLRSVTEETSLLIAPKIITWAINFRDCGSRVQWINMYRNFLMSYFRFSAKLGAKEVRLELVAPSSDDERLRRFAESAEELAESSEYPPDGFGGLHPEHVLPDG
ncbi:serine/threonine-protein kinase bud32 [Saxophila tyrrhenica]|uniref:EKC/KEOPS complex subunit BUD32 n=1 Tax=Saxophila tyrrhenica TaxID=1690608 RepID=A0AAV9PDV0_9PEZI|nr:serine/threonine-protein kinase bud32 [Saxophila tyrrhenica]